MSTPKIRFKGFMDDWEQRKVEDTITEVSRPVELKDNELYQLLTVKRRNEGIVSRGKLLGKDILVKNYFEVHNGDYVISKRQLIHGANGVIPYELDKSVVSNEYMVCVSNDKITAEFLGWLSKTTGLKRDFFLSSYGVDVEKMVFNVDDWKKRDLIIPSIDEQNKITSYFSNLDNLINLHQRKCEALKEVKKYMLQKMFPKKGEKVPEIRFAGVTGDWEQRTLGDIAEVKDSARIPNNEWTESGVPYIRASDITNEDLSGFLFISRDKYEFYKNRTGAPAENDVLFNGGGEIGKAVLNREASPIYVQGGAVLYVRTSASDYLRGDYLVSYFSTKLVQQYIEVASAGGTMKHFTLKPAQNMPVALPSLEEQKKIGTYFSNLDKLIDVHQRKCDTLKEIKKYMLQNMFPKG